MEGLDAPGGSPCSAPAMTPPVTVEGPPGREGGNRGCEVA